ncbi:MASE1 domain-containing protein [Flavobacterium sp. M31R6]|uniref:MASE1 domain-containing protein n=1 Tax=Flavobacterium sp. M31R6 TaxID=2739062 RepID=UPI0015685C3E|nr:MASE1 domain-containing protein [Flavobacterium sp. M31R6]QKJ61615.1 MASE1 domain-containing protein [Flavobacterium sp. M31R6]
MKSKNSLNFSYSIPSLLRSTPIAVLVVATLYILLAKISFLLTIDESTVSPIFLAAGFAFGSTLILGRNALIGIWIGSLYSNTLLSNDLANLDKTLFLNHLPIAFFISIGSVIASISATIIVTRFCEKEHPLSNGKNVLTLLILGPIAYSTITSLIGVASFFLNGSIPVEQFWYTYKTWWLGDAIGIILITPLMLSWFSKDSFNTNNFNFLEITLYGLATILLCFGVFFQYHDLKYLILPLLFWSAYRFGIQITTLFIIIIALFAIITTAQGIGPFNEERINDSILFLDLFLSVTIICSLFLAGIISERKKTEDSIKTSEKRLRENQTLLESTLESPKGVSIYSLGRNFEYLSFNSQHSINMKVMYGIDIALGMKLQDCMINKDELDDSLAVLSKVFLGENITTVRHFEFNDSYWEFRTSPIVNQNDEIIGATVISTNISKKIKAEEALKKSEEKYRNIFENIQDVIFQIDPNGIFWSISPSIKDITGYTPEELIGKPTNVLQTDEEKPDAVIKIIQEKFILKNFEKLVKTKSGELICVSLNAKMIFDKNGIPHHIDAIAQDITQRKKDEKEIANQNQKLQIQNKELEQFAYITSHDLQEPLLTLKYFSELIKADFPKETNENINQYLNFILESSNRMQRLVKGLLDYSRIGSQIELTKVDCNEIVNNTISTLSDTIQKTETQIIVDDLPQVQGSSVELIQLFQNLIENAIKFRKKETPLTINITAKQVEDNWQFAVQDNGIGIEEQNKEKAFIIFKRLNNRDEYPGIGIGLSICKKIVALHRGSIWVESTIGQGTIVYFNLPK